MAEPPAKKAKQASSKASLTIEEKYEVILHGQKHNLSHAGLERCYRDVKQP